MTKRIISIFMAILIVGLLITGCSDSGSGQSNDKNAPANSTEKPSDSGESTAESDNNFNPTGYPIVNEPITFTAMHPQSSNNAAFDEILYFQKMEEISNIHIEWIPVPATDWDTKVNLAFASGELPDIIYGSITPDTIYDYGVVGDYIVDISDGIEKYMPNLQHWLKEYPDIVAAITQLDGSIYYAPYIYDTAQAAGDTVYVRMDFLNKVGLSVPTTVDEFYNMLVEFKKADFAPDFAPLMPSNSDHLYKGGFAAWAYSAFGDSVDLEWGLDSDGNVEYVFINDQYKRYIEFVTKLYTEGLIEPEIFTMDEAANIAKMRENKAAVLTYATQLTADNFESGELEVEIIPPLVSEYTSTRKIRSMSHGGAAAAAITSECDNVEAALRWFDIGYAVEDILPGFNHLSGWLGIRGYNWDYTDDTKESIKYWIPEDMADKAGDMTVDEFRVYYIAPSQGPRAACAWFIPESGGLKMKSEQSIKNIFPYMVESFPATSLKFNDEESEIIANKYTDIQTYVNQQLAKFITGTEPLSKWDEYVAQVKKMGIDDVVKVYQAAYDRLNSK